jgi:hypothetical protein
MDNLFLNRMITPAEGTAGGEADKLSRYGWLRDDLIFFCKNSWKRADNEKPENY